ncbi:MAG TPA: hypothetical protein PKA42_03115 [Candidatus Paceibacterota bacterium]|nr:hypothetical protein [Candidatus Paceibacterota bacterium]HMO83135.1 hypothetical protein [Candidatus Paceibacterota bacterium]
MKKIIIIAFVVIAFVALFFLLLNNYIYTEKQMLNDLETEMTEIQLEGLVLAIDTEAMMVDGPAIIKMQSTSGEEYDIAVPSMGRNLCAAATIADPGLIAIGNTVKVSGTLTAENVVVPCEKKEHYLEIFERVVDQETDISFAYRKSPDGYFLDTQALLGDNEDFVRSYVLIHENDVRPNLGDDEGSDGPPTISVQVYRNSKNLTVDQWIKEAPGASNINLALSEVATTTVSGRLAYQYRADGLYATDYYVFGVGDYIYLFTAAYSTGESPLILDLQTLLESLNFGANLSDEGQPSTSPASSVKTATFVGNLEEVNSSCLADGECSVTVSGKKIVTLIGWNTAVVGTLLGVEGLGNLNDHLGARVEVYAAELEDGSYTLYGSNNFYVKLLDEASFSVKLGEIGQAFKLSLRPLSVISDSRCPIDVTCIQAGTVEIEADLATTAGNDRQNFTLHQTVTTETAEITLVRVDPVPSSQSSINNTDYVFHFKVKKL